MLHHRKHATLHQPFDHDAAKIDDDRWIVRDRAVTDDLIGEIEFLRIHAPVFLHVGFVAVGRDGDPLRWQRHLRGSDVTQIQKGGEGMCVTVALGELQDRLRPLVQRLQRSLPVLR